MNELNFYTLLSQNMCEQRQTIRLGDKIKYF
jgi:hypothetical protein